MWASRLVIGAICLMAISIAGCGGSGRPLNNDGSANADGVSLDYAAADTGPDAIVPLCVVPADCPAFLTCCVRFESGASGVVSCQAACVPDGSTWLVCATDADCPAALPICVDIATAPDGRPFRVCES